MGEPIQRAVRPENRSPREPENRSPREPENRSPREPENRSPREPENRARREPAPERSAAAAGAPGAMTELIRRFAALGLSGFFTTESAIRKAFGDTVPQEWVDFVTSQSERSRQELFDRLAAEMGRILEGLDVAELLDQLVTDRTIEIDARVRIGPRRKADAPGDDEA